MSAVLKPCVIFNPTARGDKARHFRSRLGERAAAWTLQPTTGPDSARSLAREAVEAGCTTLVAAGGDGTIHEVLNGVGDAERGFEKVRLGVIPLGTANVFARELGIPFPLERCWKVLEQGHTRAVDLLRVDCLRDGTSLTRRMVQVGGAGLDARAVELVNWKIKKRAGVLAYVLAGLQALRERPPCITLTTSDTAINGELVLLGNGRFYGGPFALFPAADLSDGLIDARVFDRAGWATAFACGLGILTRRFGASLRTVDLRASSFRLHAATRVALQLDGEWVGELPATFEVEPRRLQVIAPERTT